MKSLRIAVVLLLGWGCSQGPVPDAAVAAGEASAAPGGPAASAAAGDLPGPSGSAGIECAPEELVAGDTLRIRLQHPRGPYLAVESPGGTSYFLAYPTHGDTSSPLAWIPEDQFSGASEVRLPTARVRVSPWQAAAVRPELVFAGEGVYRITVSENLETDMEAVPQATCEVRLVQRR